MGRRSRRDSYTSKGERRNVSRRWLKLASKDRDDKLYNGNTFDDNIDVGITRTNK